ncbi:PsiF family protein [Actimicrobium sp. CCC2.4]|uniref:PsiF family protein n=1 Tax=Actimicrobium sp. CCC2.4 TaxID=3048606 RepID=UPI002AC8F2D0|nr:PsiF family protein [Actimicrobium sp. CCC2.4]MEB0136468.1 PsiF family protein [Actimicrobium sp. CCC2.4]WPX30828.1 PsiF family protein [Actimicrobium sp. CCC2.4]
MKHILAILLLAVPFCFNSALAATDQQTKMGTCNKEATGKKGDERKAFMKQCLSAKPAADAPAAATAAAPATQQGKMKTCNTEATGKKGDERKAFMKECLKKAA